MGELIIFILFVLLLIISIIGVIRKNAFAPHTIFSLIWCVLLSIYLLNIGHFYSISTEASLLLLTGCVGFILGSFMVTNHKQTSKRITSSSLLNVNRGLFLLFSLLTIAVFITTAIENIGYLMMGMDFHEIINQRASEEETSQGFFLTVSSLFVAVPFVYVSVPVLGLELCKKKKSWWIILVSFIILTLYILQSARRSMLIYIIPAIFYLIISNQKFISNKRDKRKIYTLFIIIVSVIVIGVSWLSFQRGTSFQETGKEYVAGCFPSFSQRIEKVDTWYMGAGTLHGALVPIMIGRKYLVHNTPEWWKQLDGLVEAHDDIQIGPTTHMNAFNTMFYVPYLDFGFLGVLVIPFLIGILYGFVYRKTKYTPTSQNRAIYSILIIGLFGSMYTLYFTQYPYLTSFAYLFILFNKKSAK